jgi:hypothetical protein
MQRKIQRRAHREVAHILRALCVKLPLRKKMYLLFRYAEQVFTQRTQRKIQRRAHREVAHILRALCVKLPLRFSA